MTIFRTRVFFTTFQQISVSKHEISNATKLWNEKWQI